MATAESVWNNCLKFIKDNIQIQAYKTWFEPIKPSNMKIMSLVFKYLVNSFTNGLKNITSNY